MHQSYDFLKSIINSVTEHIVVINGEGRIQFVNEAWVVFSRDNNCLVKREEWQGVNYLEVCAESAAGGEDFGEKAAAGIRQVIERERELFAIEYPCHSPQEKRWFMMRVTPFQLDGDTYCAISHENVTERKLAEEQVLNLSRLDGLTNIPNRRSFDEFLASEWNRCQRLKLPLTLAMLDIDHFKLLNDHYGHQAGDECLTKVGEILNQTAKRPGDLFARYGGEEFAFVFGNTTGEQALVPLRKIVDAIDALGIPHEKSPTKPVVTVSIGLATTHPTMQKHARDLIGEADKMLYAAKHNGRNRIEIAGEKLHDCLAN